MTSGYVSLTSMVCVWRSIKPKGGRGTLQDSLAAHKNYSAHARALGIDLEDVRSSYYARLGRAAGGRQKDASIHAAAW